MFRDSPSLPPSAEPVAPFVASKTTTELAFEQAQRERLRKKPQKSHREKVAEFNDKLAKLSEHHDIPKVGPG